MIVKKYSSTSIRSAIAKVKKELGDDALILSTKRLPRTPNDPYKGDVFQIEAMLPQPDVTMPEDNLQNVLPDLSIGENNTSIGNSMESTTGWELLQKELGNIKEILYSVNYSDVFSELLQTHPTIFSIYSRLIRTGLSEKRVQMIITRGLAANDQEVTTPSDYSKLIYKKLISITKVQTPFYKKTAKSPGIVAFVGPTGVGKTTTIAKLAAKLHIEKKMKVGLISIDNYRIGAFDQLKTYAAIIGIPCIPAFTKDDLVKALNKLESMDYLLIDTAGQSHLDNKRLSELRDIMRLDCDFSTQLVISATTGRFDMKEFVESFKILNPSGYIFTKVDETKRRGGIIDQLIEYQLPVSFLTNGQEVPEDLVVANEKNILQILINPDDP